MYQITLYDYNCNPIADGVVRFFSDDIEDFQKRWFILEDDEERKGRFFRSKNGEIVTDYYSDDADINIVQKDDAIIYDEKKFEINKKEFKVENIWGFYYRYYADKINVLFKWISFKGKYYRIATFKVTGICEVNEEYGINIYSTVACYGNRVLENITPFVTNYKWIFPDLQQKGITYSYEDVNKDPNKFLDKNHTTLDMATKEAFIDNTLQSICYLTNEYFKTEKEVKEDISKFEVTDEILDLLFKDIVGNG